MQITMCHDQCLLCVTDAAFAADSTVSMLRTTTARLGNCLQHDCRLRDAQSCATILGRKTNSEPLTF